MKIMQHSAPPNKSNTEPVRTELSESTNIPMKKKLNCILLIDDNMGDNMLHKITITQMGITEKIDVAKDGEEAIAYLTKEKQVAPDLIFLDINMPKINGWEFLEAYKNFDKKNKAKVLVILTTSQNPDDEKKAELINEVKGFLIKPLSEEDLKEIIEKYFEGTKPNIPS